MISSFNPWIDENTKVLVVGTMPSVLSLQTNMYYGNKQNNFWRYMQNILAEKDLVINWDKRREILAKHKIGLWDALAICEREGSLDSAIKDEVPNDFKEFQQQIKYYIFNGQKAFKYFEKYNKYLLQTDNFAVLPSTSPANASIKNEEKFARWQKALREALKK